MKIVPQGLAAHSQSFAAPPMHHGQNEFSLVEVHGFEVLAHRERGKGERGGKGEGQRRYSHRCRNHNGSPWTARPMDQTRSRPTS